jgi:hypothetical protein
MFYVARHPFVDLAKQKSTFEYITNNELTKAIDPKSIKLIPLYRNILYYVP